jgi:hypothetical protein
MKSASASLATGAFAAPDAGFDYFGTAGHCQHLARGILDALCRGSLVLVTGDPALNLPMLAEALRTAAEPRQVIEISCSPDLDHKKLLGGSSLYQETKLADGSAELTRDIRPGSPVFVLGDADRLSDPQIKDFLEAAQSAPPELQGPEAAVLLARPAFLDRLERPLLHILKDGIAAHLSVQHLDRDEIEAFIHHQLSADEQAHQFTPQRVALIAVTTGGDPAAVNRLARRMLEIEPGASTGGRRAKRSWSAGPPDKRSNGEPHASGDGEKIAKSQTRWPGHRAAFGLAGITIAATALWLIIGSFGSHQLQALVGIARDWVSPLVDSSAASVKLPARAATALPPAITRAGASPVAPAGASPVAATSLSLGVTAERAAAAERTAPVIMPRRTAPEASLLQSPSSEPLAPSRPAPPNPAAPRLSAAETAALVARGDGFLSAGDVTSARSFFERAADAGDSQAAMRMAVTFDPAFLSRAGVHGVRGDPEQASFWYQRARNLSGAEPDQRRAETGPSGAPPTR